MTAHAKTIALTVAFAALAAGAALAKDLTIGVSSEASSIDPHFHALTPNIQVRLNSFESLTE
jgi:peptide/nickel transport system substrate-binding protein